MLYHSKREVLERLGKNVSDNKLVDRMITRGEVKYENGVYIIMSEYYDNLEWKVKDLERQLQEEKEKSEGTGAIIQATSVLDDGEVEELRGKVDELERMVLELENDKKDLEGKVYKLTMEGNTSSDSDLEEAKIQREYYKGLYEEEKSDKQKRIRKAFSWIKQIKPKADWDEFRDWLMSDES